jgi:nucleotide-binding universal stress UspA family protein
MKTILLHVHEDNGQETRLQAALDLARNLDAHLTCVQATPFDAYIVGDPFGGVYAFPEIIARIREGEEESRAHIEEGLANEGVSWNWVHFDGSAAQVLVEQARLADLIVVSQARQEGSGEPLPVAADVALHASTAVLAVPPGASRFDIGGVAAVAWNGAAESAHALRFALPLLAKASAVHIITVSEEESDFPATAACTYLSRHGISSELHVRKPNGGVPAALRDEVRKLGAAYLVMGAYGRSRLRQMVLGGVTSELLRTSEVPLLLAH